MGAGGLRAAHLPSWLTGWCTRPHLGPLHTGCLVRVETLAHFLSPHFPGVGKQPVLGREPAVPPGGPHPPTCPTQKGRPTGGSPRSRAESEVPGRNRRFRLLIPLLNAPPTTPLSDVSDRSQNAERSVMWSRPGLGTGGASSPSTARPYPRRRALPRGGQATDFPGAPNHRHPLISCADGSWTQDSSHLLCPRLHV